MRFSDLTLAPRPQTGESRTALRVYALTVGLLLAAVTARALLDRLHSPLLRPTLALLLLWLILLLTGAALPRRQARGFALCLGAQALLAVGLMALSGGGDYFAALLMILAMQVMRRFGPRRGARWIALFALLLILPMTRNYGLWQGLAYALIYTAGSALFAAYALAIERTQAAYAANRDLLGRLAEANRQLQRYAAGQERAAAIRQRAALARDLHDSVTQTLFSLTLTAQAALLLSERDPDRVGGQLDRLHDLAQAALATMRTLVAELRPPPLAEGLAAALRQHAAERQLTENLAVTVEITGDPQAPLSPAEELGLFRIAQEALNNVVKHAGVAQATVRLHLAQPVWLEISDRGQGFTPGQAGDGGRLGLAGMRERAAEIGWRLEVASAPGAGARIRVEKTEAGGPP